MALVISSLNKEKVFENKEFITIGSNQSCDYVLDTNFEFMLTIRYNATDRECVVINNFNSDKILFRGEPMGEKLSIEKVGKLFIKDSDNFIGIKILATAQQQTMSSIADKDFTESEIKELYGNDVNATTRLKLEKRKSDIEKNRIAIIKEVAYAINDIKKRINLNTNASICLNVAMFFCSIVLAFGVSNFLMGLPINQTQNFINMPTNIKVLAVFSFIIFGIHLILKQGVYLFAQNKVSASTTSKLAEKFMIITPTIFLIAVYVINLIYYMNPNGRVFFAILISLFFTALGATLSASCGYFKFIGHTLSKNLDKYEYREDFEEVMNEYQSWIEKHINNISPIKLSYIKDKLFMLQLKGLGETVLGVLTAPFLAYGVSNTLAMCFPEAAGWVRISGLRFSPVFLVLATLLIVFAFFAFVNAFFCTKKIQGSNVIKQDGFKNFADHGVDIYGLESVRKLEREKARSLSIGLAIIFIEFSMNTSYFMTEIGGDLQGLFLSLIAALVPTALLIAETFMLSQTKFESSACDSLISKLDK